jgi:hypothetical protein
MWFESTGLEVGAARHHVGEKSLKLPQVFSGRGMDNYGPIAPSTLHFFHAEPVPAQSPLGLGWAEVDVQPVAFVSLHLVSSCRTFGHSWCPRLYMPL